MVALNQISKQYGGRTLFSNVSLTIGQSERCVIVGRNGSGKSTLLRMIENLENPDSGTVTVPKGTRLGSLPQHLHFESPTIIEEAALGLPDHEKDELHTVKKILSGLGMPQEYFDKSPSILSGGFRLRLALAKVLATNADVLLLDEPTNYLDIVSVRWLERFLQRLTAKIIFVTHDRTFANNVCTHVLGITKAQIKKVPGTVDKYYELLLHDEKTQQATRENVEKKRAHLQSFVDRFGAKASKATQAQSKMKAIEKLEIQEDLVHETSLDFRWSYKPTATKQALLLDSLSFSYDTADFIRGISLELGPQDRLAVIGKNGCGKSTFLRLLVGELKPKGGLLRLGSGITCGYFGQGSIDTLDLNATLEEEMQNTPVKVSFEQLRCACGVMLFRNEDMKKKIRVLSGGERSRVVLAKIILTPSNLLILDEPTHHLDLDSIAAMQEAIKAFGGAAILVSHDEALLHGFCAAQVLLFHKNGQERFLGSYATFLETRGWDEEKEEKKSLAAPVLTTTPSPLPKNKTRLRQLETTITALELEKESISAELSAAYTPDLLTRYEATCKKLDRAYEEYEKL